MTPDEVRERVTFGRYAGQVRASVYVPEPPKMTYHQAVNYGTGVFYALGPTKDDALGNLIASLREKGFLEE